MSIKRASTSYIHSLDNPLSFGAQKRKYSNASSGLGPAQFFTSNSQYTRPSNVLYIDLLMVGGGGGGGQNNYGAGGGGGNIYYIKKLYIGDANTYYCWIGRGGQPGGNNGNNWGQAPNEGDIGVMDIVKKKLAAMPTAAPVMAAPAVKPMMPKK